MTTMEPPQPDAIPDRAETRPKTILVVEAYRTLCSLIWCQLRALGYRVLTAYTGATAQDVILGNEPSSIDLLIIDCDMPLTPGDQLARCFLKANPEAKVMLMSSHGRPPSGENVGFIQKPFEVEEMCDQVRIFLDGELPCAA